MAEEQITVSVETLRHLFDLAVDSPLLCSGSFDTDDVEVLRRIAAMLGVDPAKATPDEFITQFRHPFVRRYVRDGPLPVWEWVKDGLVLTGPMFGARSRRREETVEELHTRIAEERADETCQAGESGRRCGLLADDPKHRMPPHPTCADVNSFGKPPGSEWVCSDGCPRPADQATRVNASNPPGGTGG